MLDKNFPQNIHIPVFSSSLSLTQDMSCFIPTHLVGLGDPLQMWSEKPSDFDDAFF